MQYLVRVGKGMQDIDAMDVQIEIDGATLSVKELVQRYNELKQKEADFQAKHNCSINQSNIVVFTQQRVEKVAKLDNQGYVEEVIELGLISKVNLVNATPEQIKLKATKVQNGNVVLDETKWKHIQNSKY